jgi:hypothetical protein
MAALDTAKKEAKHTIESEKKKKTPSPIADIVRFYLDFTIN